MPLEVHLVPVPVAADVAVIIDVLRFTTSATHALANGARAIFPCETLDQARAALSLLPSEVLLAGERHAVKPAGFHLGNSPGEFTSVAVAGRDIVWTTTNGTRAIALALGRVLSQAPPSASAPFHTVPVPVGKEPRDLILASYVNLSAVASLLEPLLREGAVVAVACSGREGGFALEDAACAGRLVNTLRARIGDALTVNDGARASACIDEAYGEDIPRIFRDAQHGRFLRQLGGGADLDACAALDAVPVVPRWLDGRFVAR